MGCSRCGQGRPRPATPPATVGRPGGVVVPPQRVPVPSNSVPSSIIRDAITGMRYIPDGK